MKKIKKSSFVFTLIFGFILNSAVLLFAVQKTEVKKETVVQTKVESNKEKISTEKAAVQVKAEKEKAAAQVKADKEKVAAEKAERVTAEVKVKQDAVTQAKAEKEKAASQTKADKEKVAAEKAVRAVAEAKAKQDAIIQAKAEKEKAAAQVKADKEKVIAEKAERATAEVKAKQDAVAQAKAEKEKAAAQVKADKEKVVAEKAERATAEAKAKQDAVAQAEAEKQEIIKPFYVYSNIGSNLNHYIPSGYMGDTEDLKIKRISGNNSSSGNGGYLELTYTQKSDGGKGWAGVYWLEPVDNWGTSSGGYNLKGFNSLTFLAKGLTGNEVISEVKIGGIKGKYSDSTSGSLKNVRLTKDWQLYTMDLRGKKMSRIAGGFCVVFDKYNNPNGCTIYLNEIKYEIQK